jgi:PKD repeat protein
MRLFSKLNRSARRMTAGIVLLLTLTASALISVGNSAAAASCPGYDDSANAVIYCGVSSVNSLVNKYDHGDSQNSAASIQHIYSSFGISSSDINSMSSNTQMGSVSSSGDVSVNGRVVASNVLTAGRQNMTNACGSSTPVTVSGTKFYSRKPCVSFASSPLQALVVMKNGVFQFAILTSCGNPVKATPKTSPPAPKPAPQPTPVKPAPTPKPTPVTFCSGNTTNSNSGVASQGGNCSTNSTVVTTPSASGQCSSLGLNMDQSNPLALTATVSFQTQGDSQLQSIVYNFGDGSSIPPTTDQTMTHTYQQAGTYTISAAVSFSGASGGSSTCQTSITLVNAQPTCDALSVSTVADQTASIDQFQTTSNGGSFTGADINWGDGTVDNSVNPVEGQTHQYASPGTYNVSLVPHFDINGQDVTAASQSCQQQISFAPVTTVTTTSTPTPPASANTSLINTGAGNVAAVFGLATVAGVLTYRYYLRRHLLKG